MIGKTNANSNLSVKVDSYMFSDGVDGSTLILNTDNRKTLIFSADYVNSFEILIYGENSLLKQISTATEVTLDVSAYKTVIIRTTKVYGNATIHAELK